MTLADELRTLLLRADYTVDVVLERLGPQAQAGLHRNSTMPANHVLRDDHSELANLIRLFILGQSLPPATAEEMLPVSRWVSAGLLEVRNSDVSATVDVRPYGFETASGSWQGWVVADHTPGLDFAREPIRPDYVLGVSPASTTLAQMTIDARVNSALDLGTGCGVQSLHLAGHAEHIVATDINPRCLQLARLTAELNQIDVELRSGSLYEPVAGERFDLIVTNPPYVISPPAEHGRLVYREAGLTSDDLVRTVVTKSIEHLNPGGSCQVLGNWAITDQPWQDRLASWAPAGADMWVIERERVDPFEYIELWLTDAGLAGSPQWAERYDEWLAYFEELGIRSIGMGWITVTNAGREHPDICFESWPHEVAQPVGPVIAGRRASVDAARLSDEELLASCWQLRSDVVQETFGRPGAEDPQHVVLRQGTGLKRAMSVDTALGGVLGACDASMPLGVVIDAVAQLTAQDASELRTGLLPDIRSAIIDGYLHQPADG